MDKIEACGIEVSAAELVVALSGKAQETCCADSRTPRASIAVLQALTRGGKRVRACMEATGVYGLDVALLLSAHAGIELMVANPRAVRHFAQALMQRSKNYQLDAVMLREFALRIEFTAWTRPYQSTLSVVGHRATAGRADQAVHGGKNRQHAAEFRKPCPRVCEPAWRERYSRCSARSKHCVTRPGVYRERRRIARRYQLLCTMPRIGRSAPCRS